jgi:amino acid transporter
MGRSEAIPKGFFAKLHAKRGIPANNVMLIGVLALAGALCDMLREPFRISYEKGAEMLNFGAFIAFMGVNVAAFVRYFCARSEGPSGILPGQCVGLEFAPISGGS